MKEVEFKDEKETMQNVVKYLEKIKTEPEKYMPICILCHEEKSWVLLIHQIEGMHQTAFFGVCEKCWPRKNGEELTKEIVDKIMEKVKTTIENGDSILKLTHRDWVQ